MPKGFTVLADSPANIAYVPTDVFTVKYALYDGSVVETQKVGFGMNAVLPEGNWVNAEEATKKATFIDGNVMIMLVREGDNIGGNYVSVKDGAISNYGTWSENFAVFAKGANATVTPNAHPDGYTFKGWQVNGEIVSTSATYTFAVNSNIKLVAKYNVPMHTVTVVNGTIDGIADTTASIEDTTKITVIANAIPGKVFQGWSNGTEIVSNNKTYSFTVKAPITLTATYIDAYTVNIDMSEVGGTDTKYIVDSEGHKVAKPDVSDVDAAPTNAELGFVTDDGKVWDFDKDVITRDITIYGKWVAIADLNEKAWKMQGASGEGIPDSAVGSAVGVDLSDGSTLTMEFDIFDANILQANYNFYVYIRADANYGPHSNTAFAYANYAYYSPWPYHGNIAGTNSTTSNNWSPILILAENQSVKISYTAPTNTKNGSLVIYIKHIEATEWSELCYVKDIPIDTVTNTKKVFMGIELENASSWCKFMNFRMYVNDYEYDIPAAGINGYMTETENTYVKPVKWADGREYNIRVNTDAGVDARGSFNMWFGNGAGVDLDEGESLTWEFTIDSVEYGLWYNVWGGIMVNSGAFPASVPSGNVANGIGWSSNFALNTSNYSGRTASLIGASKGSAAFATGYNLFDPYTDVTGNYTTGIAPIMIKVVYTSYDETNNVPGSIVYYKKLKSAGSWTKVTEVTGITAKLYDSMHISLWYNSSQNAGGAWDFDISNFTYYTSGSKSIVPVIGVGGNGVCTGSLPTYTVKFMNGSTTVSTQKVEEGSLATEQSLAGYTPALGGMYVWADKDGNVFDFETSIESDTTLYLTQIADPAVKDATWQLTAESKSWLATLGTSVPMDLSDGSTATVEFDVVEGLPDQNYDAGFYLWRYLPSNQNTDNGYFSGFADNRFLGNSAHKIDEPEYVGKWNTEDYGATGYTFGEKFRPHEIFATGKTVKAVYTAPTASTTGSIIIYTKNIGAEDSAYAEQASIRNLTTAMVCNTDTTYMGFGFRQGAEQSPHCLDMTIENYHIYTAKGDVPALYDYNQMVVTNKSVSEELPDTAYTGEDTIGNTYQLGYAEGTTAASGWFGSKDGVTLATDEVLYMEFEVVAAGNKWQNANSGFTVCNIDPTTQTTSPQNFYSLSGVTSFAMYGNWADDMTTYENRIAHLLGASGATISGIWDPYTDVAAGDWVKVEYKPNSANSAGYFRVYTKAGLNGTYVMNCSIEGITLDLDTDVRIVWFVSARSGGLNFTHTITNYRMYTSKGTALTNTDSWGGNQAVTVTEG